MTSCHENVALTEAGDGIVCNTAVFSVVTQRSSPLWGGGGGAGGKIKLSGANIFGENEI